MHLSTLSYGLTASWDVRRRAVDVALVLNTANGYWLPLIRRAQVPIALNVDGLEWERGKWNSLGQAAFKAGAAMSARWATRLVADSHAIADVWKERFAVEPDYIPYGADVYEDDADDELAARGIAPGEYVLTVARLVPENNIRLTLEALDLLGDRPPHVIVGSGFGSPLEQHVRQVAAERADVLYLGHVDDQRLLTQLFRHCLLYVHGHSVGGTNPALLQAMGAGAPALAYDSVFNREVMGDDLDVYFRDAPGLAEQMVRLLESPNLLTRVAEQGPTRVERDFRWSEVTRRYLKLLADLAAETDPSRPRATVAA